MQKIRTDTWHFGAFRFWNAFKDVFLNIFGGSRPNWETPARVGLCEYVRGIALAVLVAGPVVATLALGFTILFLVIMVIIVAMWLAASAGFLLTHGTVSTFPTFSQHGDFPRPLEGRYRLAYTVRGWTIRPYHLFFAGAILYLYREIPAFQTAVDTHSATVLDIGMGTALAAASAAAIWLVARRVRRTDAWHLLAAYAKAVADKSCPVLEVVDPNADPANPAK